MEANVDHSGGPGHPRGGDGQSSHAGSALAHLLSLAPATQTGHRRYQYGTIENIKAIEDAHIRAYIPIPEIGNTTAYYGLAQFTYDAEP